MEKRSIQTQLRAVNDNGVLRIGGYAATFHTLSSNLGGFREKIAPGAFTKSLARRDDVRALMNHDPSQILGRTKSGTLTLSEDSHGLRFVCDLPDTSYARDLHNSVTRGDIDECSFGFQCDPDGDDYSIGEDEDGMRCNIRTLRSVKLLDVSACTYPAYPNTAVGTRSRTFNYSVRFEFNPADDFLRRKQAVLGAEIALSDERARKDDELFERMRHAAGIVSGRRKR